MHVLIYPYSAIKRVSNGFLNLYCTLLVNINTLVKAREIFLHGVRSKGHRNSGVVLILR